jgi:hypothetical protein
MASPFDTIQLDAETWDVAVVGGSFVVLSGAFAQAQDMQSAIRLVQGEYIYDDTAGVPYLSIFGQTTSLPVLKADIAGAAATIPGTSNVVTYIEAVQDRCVSGQVQADVETPAGTATVAASISDNINPIVFAPVLTGQGEMPLLTGGTGGPLLTGGLP